MAPDDTDGRKPSAPAILRIKLRYDSVEAMVNRFAPNVGKLGIFLPTRSIHPPGTEIKFELKLVTDVPMLVGLGRVMSSHEPDPNNPRAVFGIAVEIIRVTREGRHLLVRLIERRRAMGLPDVAIPIPADIHAARRADIDTQPRAQIPTPGTSLLAHQSANVMTAPRVTPTPRANHLGEDAADRSVVPTLTPEPARPPRRRVADVIAAAHPIAAVTEDQANLLNHDVDIESTRARARALASGDLDNELAMLRDASAAPLVAIEVEAASAELARHLGGIAVKRDRSTPVAVPVVIAAAPAINDRGSETSAAEAEASHRPQNDAMIVTASPEPEPETETAEPAPNPRSELRHTFRRRSRSFGAIRPGVPRSVADPTPIPDDVANDSGRSPTAVDEIAPSESAATTAEPEFATDSSAADANSPETAHPSQAAAEQAAAEGPTTDAEPLIADVSTAADQHDTAGTADPVVSPEPEEDDPDLLSFERDLDAARIQTGVTHTPAPPAPTADVRSGDDDDDDDVDELDDSELEHLRVITPAVGIAVSSTPTLHPDETAIPASAREVAMTPSPNASSASTRQPRPPEGEEVSDVDVLAEANEEDDDLLHAHLRRDELIHSPPVMHAPSAPEFLDPADLPHIEVRAPLGEPIVHNAEPVRNAQPSALRGNAYADYDDAYEDAHYEEASYEDQPAPRVTSNVSRQYPDDFDYDFASRLDLDDDDEPAHVGDDGSYTFADRISAARVVSPPAALDDPYGLEDALSNLGADSEQAPADKRPASPTRRPPLPGVPAELGHEPASATPRPPSRRFATDDGVMIDFDDDDES